MKLTMKKDNGFTLVEILIVVCILGILAAIVAPHYTNATIKAKEAAAKETLHMFRTQIQRYKIEHNNIPPGYTYGKAYLNANSGDTMGQLIYPSDINGHCAALGTPGFDFGPYLSDLPKNPFNNSAIINAIDDEGEFPTEEVPGIGWLYHGPTATIRINAFGTDSEGIDFQDY